MEQKRGEGKQRFQKEGGWGTNWVEGGCLRAGTTLRTMKNLEEILRIFVFTDFIKNVKFSMPASVDLEGTPNPIPDRFFLCIYL